MVEKSRCRSVIQALVAIAVLAASGQPSHAAHNARQIVETSGISSGLVVHLGCGDGQLTVACFQKGGQWTKLVKSWPAEVDEWAHWMHAPDGNPVSRDRLVGPPRQTQWIDGLPYSRSTGAHVPPHW